MKMMIITLMVVLSMVYIVSAFSKIVEFEPFEIIKSGAEIYVDVTYDEVNETAYKFCFDFNDKAKYLDELAKLRTELAAEGSRERVSEDSIPITKLTDDITYSITKNTLDMSTGLLDWSSKDCFILNFQKIENVSFKVGWNSVLINSTTAANLLQSPTDSIARGANGELYTIYGSGGDLHFSNSSDNGTTWSTQTLELTYFIRGGVIVDSSNFIILYYENASGDDDIYMWNSSDGGVSWNDPLELNTGLINDASEPSCVFDINDNWHCCYIHQNLAYYQNSTNSPTYVLEADLCDIGVDSNNIVYIVGVDASDDNIYIIDSTNGLDNDHSTRIDISNSWTQVRGSSLEIVQDKLYVTWVSTTGLRFCNSTTSNPQIWNCTTLISDSSLANPVIASNKDGENIEILYDEGGGANDYLNRSYSNDYGVSWNNYSICINCHSPSISSTYYPSSNRVTDTIYYVFVNRSNGGVYFDSYTIPYAVIPDSSFTVTLPIGYDYAVFRAITNTSENIIPDGQDNDTAFMVVSNTGNQVMNFTVNLNATISDITLKADTDNTSIDSTEVTDSPLQIYTSLSPSQSFGVWLWSDFNDAVIQDTNRSMNLTAIN